jgi:hypothetical protein
MVQSPHMSTHELAFNLALEGEDQEEEQLHNGSRRYSLQANLSHHKTEANNVSCFTRFVFTFCFFARMNLQHSSIFIE